MLVRGSITRRAVAPSRRVVQRSNHAAHRSVAVKRAYSTNAAPGDEKAIANFALQQLPPETRLKLLLEVHNHHGPIKPLPSNPTFWDELPARLINTYWELTGYRKYGLLLNDVIADDFACHEAITRLPKSMQELRANRIKLALFLSSKAKTLPEEQWTKAWEDVPYLQPYLAEVERELMDRKMFRAKFF